jgi:hypothetical protein
MNNFFENHLPIHQDRETLWLIFDYLFLIFKIQTYGIDAVANSTLILWTIRESVAKMAAALTTENLFSNHAM